MTDLIKRLEEATEGSRELDYRIACLVTCGAGPFGAYKSASQWVKAAIAGNWNSPHYTTSLDAALTLVPEGYPFALHRGRDGLWAVEVVPLDDDDDRLVGMEDLSTAPLALCIAALKARS